MKWFKKLKAKDHPGIYFPPPLLYVLIFFIAPALQQRLPIYPQFFTSTLSSILGWVFLVTGLLFMAPAVRQFRKTKNSMVTIKPATSLQTAGIYTISRNPMYVGLLCFYVAFAFWHGSWWTFIFIPLLILLVNFFIIHREEKYLERTFGKAYRDYKQKVRRWF